MSSPDWPLIVMVTAMIGVVGFILYRWVWNSNLWPANQAVLQTTYVRGCGDARHRGIAPLYSGYAGYRESLDRDRDGIACEPYPF
jgi:hypothetical protein